MRFKKGQPPWNKGKTSWSKGLHLSEEHRKNIGIARKGILHTAETKRKMSRTKKLKYAGGLIAPWNKNKKGLQVAWNKGRSCDEETRKKLSLSHLGLKNRLGIPTSEEAKKKIGVANKGRIKTEEEKMAISLRFRGKNHPMYNKHHSEASRLKMSFGHGGNGTFVPYTIDWTDTLKRAIKERDKYVCQICSRQNNLQIHHIDYDKKNCNLNNLITLCISCHSRTNINRSVWEKYFKIIMEAKYGSS